MSARCPTCHATYDAETTYCIRDGTRLVREPAPVAASVRAAASPSMGLVLGVLGGVVVVLAAAVVMLYLRSERAPVVVTVDPAGEAFGDPPEAYRETQGVAGGVVRDGDLIEDSQVAEVEVPSVPDRDLQVVGTTPPPPPRPSAASYGPTRVVTSGDGLLLRAGPGRQYDVLGKMLPNDVVLTQRCEGGTPGRRWCQVEYGGIQGWALDEFLDIGGVSQDTSSGLEDAFAAADVVGRPAYIDGSEVTSINLRARPYVGGELLTRLAPGTSLMVLRCLPYGWSLGGRTITGRWCFVNAQTSGRTISGWASDGALRW